MLGLEAMEELEIKNKKFCYGCGSNKTHINKRGNAEWRTNEFTGLYLCLSCYSKYIIYPFKRDILKHNTKYIRFHDRQIFIRKNPRKGICSWCDRKDGEPYTNRRGKPCHVKTTMHHIEYHEEDPLKDTIELCRECHQKKDWQLGKYANRPNNHQPRDEATGRFITRLSVM
jgi:hypothetical protein